MNNSNNFSNQEVFELLAATLDGIEGFESEYGSEALYRFWNPEKIEQARRLLDNLQLQQAG